MNTKKYFLHRSMQRSLSLCLLISYTVAGCSYRPVKLTVGAGRDVSHRAARSRQHHRYNFSILEPRQTASTAWSRFVSCYHAPWSKKGPKVKRCLYIGLPVAGITAAALSGIVWWLSTINGKAPAPGTTPNNTLAEMATTNDSLRNETFMPTIGLDSTTTEFILNAIENNVLADIQTEKTIPNWNYDQNNSSLSDIPLTSTLGSTTTVATTEGYDQNSSFASNLSLTSTLGSTTTAATTEKYNQNNSSLSNIPLTSTLGSTTTAATTEKYNQNNSALSDIPLTSTLGSTTTIATTKNYIQNNSSVANLPLTSTLSSTLLTSTATTQRPSSATTVGLSKEKKKALNNELIKAVKEKDDLSTVDTLLKQGADVDAKDTDNKTALIWAAEKGHLKIVNALLDKGATINLVDNYKTTALVYAAENNHTTVVNALLGKKADMNIVDKHGKTALMKSAEKGHTKSVIALLVEGATVDVKDTKGKTALDYANDNKREDIVKIFTAFFKTLKALKQKSPEEIKKLLEDALLQKESALITS